MGISRHPLCSSSTAARLPDVPADAALIRRLEASFQRISARGDEFTERFYRRLFDAQPGLRAMFPEDMSVQKKKLLDSLRVVIAHLHTPAQVRAQLEELGRAHARYGVKPDQYPIVCEMLVAAMGDESGGEWTAELNDDWSSAIRLVSEIMLEGAQTAPTSQSHRDPA
jgi:hemoglobin-like flavoprotein